ncbi:DUF1788 domain-containing protein [Sporolactobacillus nakayamae]|uniref:DUF1788 domain-containing protein n=1 Tax=Sporolactobacillus nakayamae TaxID=269670 RepID=A0A1I2QY99_9BACL|nr:DUF1788 domain-containing protein [Sporolactobacillus nakayamae]SFG31307.1 protein of unknown function [Sporolactobacillus nakayamae]
MRTIQQRLDDILPKLMNPDFMKKNGLANEDNYYIFQYIPEYEMLVRDHIAYLKQRINDDHNISFNVTEFDLYEIILSVLGKKGYLAKNFEMEQRYGSEKVYKATSHTLRLTQDDDQVIKYIREHVQSGNIIFITGVGKAFPLIRSHMILNNLFHATDHTPVILFFPGNYDGQELNLFNALKDDNYYRAFPLVAD